MIEVLKQVLLSPVGSFGFVFGSIVLIGWFVFWIHGKFVTMLANHENMKAKCEEAKKNSESAVDRIDKKIEDLRGDLHGVKGEIQYIKSTLNALTNSAQSQAQAPAMLKAHSPLSLTDVGLKAAADMNANTAIAINWEGIKAVMDRDITSRNPYDIQTYCLEKIPVAPEQFFDAKTLEAFKIYAFNNGRTLFECMKVIGILVRDKYFEVLGIPLTALDGPSPSK